MLEKYYKHELVEKQVYDGWEKDNDFKSFTDKEKETWQDLGTSAINFFKNRGISKKTAEHFHIKQKKNYIKKGLIILNLVIILRRMNLGRTYGLIST